ncbi:hypothetical protein B0H34DRAFT_855488 [Crassisporium funariophilum]|nr:hypothetical protein B0H34DRAFT_855488 [Crassisporium funariophilum]
MKDLEPVLDLGRKTIPNNPHIPTSGNIVAPQKLVPVKSKVLHPKSRAYSQANPHIVPLPPSPLQESTIPALDSSESDSDVPILIMSSTLDLATITRLTTHKGPPILGDGKITAQVLKSYENGCINFFDNAKDPVAEDVKVAKRFLDTDWEAVLKRKVLGCKLKKGALFFDWAEEVQDWNNLIETAGLKLSEDALLAQLDAGLTCKLADKCHDSAKVAAATSFSEWLHAVKGVDDGAKKGHWDRGRVHKLTDAERNLLRKYFGCFKGRIFYAGHCADQCKDYPANDEYITEAMGRAAKAARNSSTGSSSTSGSSKLAKATKAAAVVAAAAGPVSEEEAEVDSDNNVAAVGSFIVDYSSSSSEVSSPLTMPHLFWKASALGKDGFPCPVKTMFDNGAHVVLIRPDIVKLLALEIKTLKKPLPIGVAVDEGKSPLKVLLSQFVTLSLSSLDNAWTSKPFKAIVTPGLCTPLLLGLPFLVQNKIVIDHNARMAVDKASGFDLLHPVKITRPVLKEKLSPLAKRRCFLNRRAEMVAKLKLVCNARARRLEEENSLEAVNPFDVILAVKAWVEDLALMERYKSLDIQVKEDYKDLFTPIPHIDELPTDVYARIQLKDANKIIQTRQYTCPRQY